MPLEAQAVTLTSVVCWSHGRRRMERGGGSGVPNLEPEYPRGDL